MPKAQELVKDLDETANINARDALAKTDHRLGGPPGHSSESSPLTAGDLGLYLSDDSTTQSPQKNFQQHIMERPKPSEIRSTPRKPMPLSPIKAKEAEKRSGNSSTSETPPSKKRKWSGSDTSESSPFSSKKKKKKKKKKKAPKEKKKAKKSSPKRRKSSLGMSCSKELRKTVIHVVQSDS